MLRKLITHGEELALPLDRQLLEKLSINKDTIFEISTNGDNLILTPKKNNESVILESLKNINREYGSVLKKLSE